MSLFKRNPYLNYLQIYDFWLHVSLNNLIIFPFCFASVVIVLYIFYNHKLSYVFNPDPSISLVSSSSSLFFIQRAFMDIIENLKYHNKASIGSVCGLYMDGAKGFCRYRSWICFHKNFHLVFSSFPDMLLRDYMLK